MTNGASIMTVTTRRAALLLPLGASIALAGCQTTQASATSSGGDMSVADLEFVTNAFDIINFDREECGLAQTQAKSPEVKAIAGTLLAQANQFDAELRPVAQEAGVKPPTVLPTRLRIRAGRLRLGQGLDFDRAFLADQIASHQDSLTLQETVINAPSSNARLADLSRRGNALIRTNLARLQALQGQVTRPA